MRTILSFVNTTKYPPSLLYLMMTLGPAIAILPLFEKWRGRMAGFFVVFVRVPLFYYLFHLALVHALAVALALLTRGDAGFLISNDFAFRWGGEHGYSLWVVYGVWLTVVSVLYFPCRWFASLKRRRRNAWLSYL
jgi:hypothetical protein